MWVVPALVIHCVTQQAVPIGLWQDIPPTAATMDGWWQRWLRHSLNKKIESTFLREIHMGVHVKCSCLWHQQKHIELWLPHYVWSCLMKLCFLGVGPEINTFHVNLWQFEASRQIKLTYININDTNVQTLETQHTNMYILFKSQSMQYIHIYIWAYNVCTPELFRTMLLASFSGRRW